MKQLKIFKLIFVFAFFSASAQNIDVYPTHWWVGMKNPKLQLLIRLTDTDKVIPKNKLVFNSSSKDIKVVKVHHPENQRYLIVDLEIAKNAKLRQRSLSFMVFSLLNGLSIIN